MQTIQVQPGRCRGCFVVAPAEGSPNSLMLSPNTATVAKASRPVGSPSLLLSTILRLLVSGHENVGKWTTELYDFRIYLGIRLP